MAEIILIIIITYILLLLIGVSSLSRDVNRLYKKNSDLEYQIRELQDEVAELNCTKL